MVRKDGQKVEERQKNEERKTHFIKIINTQDLSLKLRCFLIPIVIRSMEMCKF